MAEKIEITIDKKGKASVHIRGVKGKRCLDITKELDDFFGPPTVRNLTSEYREAEEKQKAGVGGR